MWYYGRYGIWGVVLFIALIAARSYRLYEHDQNAKERERDRQGDITHQRQHMLDNMDKPTPDPLIDNLFEQRNRMNQRLRDQREQTQQFFQEQNERNREREDELRRQIREAANPSRQETPSE